MVVFLVQLILIICMIPVLKNNYKLIDLDNDKLVLSEKKYQKLLKE